MGRGGRGDGGRGDAGRQGTRGARGTRGRGGRLERGDAWDAFGHPGRVGCWGAVAPNTRTRIDCDSRVNSLCAIAYDMIPHAPRRDRHQRADRRASLPPGTVQPAVVAAGRESLRDGDLRPAGSRVRGCGAAPVGFARLHRRRGTRDRRLHLLGCRPRAIHYLWRPFLPDPKDDLVLEAAVAGRCDTIVTFNRRDFRGVEQFGLRIRTPREFLEELEP
jgi:hypothetical protein